ncbi:bifunctional riboflavin kinase/FAD synthetase [uncultured Psychroserpens sp.]|uniref:bifunctional riboflavin kinase/FAD synthetase n=1 Tax=uncultured Psychroserpens sp. TaxID=255436 RepID=UPI002607947E|nr:bifunctional riboflavin kinase/FAD synthetase [uncultured Psychroserpens sp.]
MPNQNTEINTSSIITIGTFDGVHIGHQKIIEHLVKTGQDKNLKSVVLTFFPHPRMVLQPDFKMQLLHTINERQEILKIFGIDNLIVKEFTKDFANLSAHDYVKTILVDELKVKHIIIGYDHHFGKNRTANIDDLRTYGKAYGFTVEEISAQDIKNVAVSSTKIRHALMEGDIKTANAYLGYPYFITGQVIKGKGIGKTLNFPTANLAIEKDYKLIPKQGVYVVRSTLHNQPVYGMMNIGLNPTFNDKKQSIEVHFFNTEENLYNRTLKVELLHRLRNEQKFESKDQLILQLNKDKKHSEDFIKGLHE